MKHLLLKNVIFFYIQTGLVHSHRILFTMAPLQMKHKEFDHVSRTLLILCPGARLRNLRNLLRPRQQPRGTPIHSQEQA